MQRLAAALLLLCSATACTETMQAQGSRLPAGCASTLLRQVTCADWSVVLPEAYIRPFLKVVESAETSGAITGVALTSILRILSSYIIGATYFERCRQS